MNIVASSNLAVGQYPFEHKAAMLGLASLLFLGLSLRVDTMDIRMLSGLVSRSTGHH